MSENKKVQPNLTSLFTSNLPDILKQLNISLAVSTYQAGKLILVRRDGQKINTHFRNFNRPMGVAVKPNRLSIGCLKSVKNFQNAPELIKRFEEPGKRPGAGVEKLETFNELKELAENSHYQAHKQKILCDLTDDMIDMPIVDLISGFNKLPYCFTLQSCYGRFIYNGQKDFHNLEPLTVKDTIAKVEYRIAYIAFCIENSFLGRELFGSLKEITAIDPENVQFCCAEWFWKRQVNSFALQVEPDRFKS